MIGISTEYGYFISGLLLGLLPLAVLIAVKKLNLLDIRPDRKIAYLNNRSQKLTLHAFKARNRNDDSPPPALLFFHGGRWLHGKPDDFYPQCQFFAAHGFSCFCAQYRLGSSTLLNVRDAVADAQSALQYLIQHAGELNIDPQQITVLGGSAGGQLAAALGAGLPADCERPVAQILYNPMIDLAPGTPDHHLVKKYWRQVSPLHHVDSAVPPSLILLGSKDAEVPLATAQAFCMAVHNAGGQCDIELYEGQGHGFHHQPQYREQTNRRILAFLKNLQD